MTASPRGTGGKRSIDYRDPRLLVAVMGAILDADADVVERDLLDAFDTGQWSRETIRSSLYDLATFGAIRRMTGNPRTRPRPPAGYRATPLGRAWADRRLEPYIGEEPLESELLDAEREDPDDPED